MPVLMMKIVVLLMLLSSQESRASDTLTRISERKTIVIAHRESSMPFSYLDDKKHPIGYAMDICEKIVEAVKRELKLNHLDVQYVLVTPANRMQIIADGKADLECGSTTNTKERRKQVDFSISYFIAGARMLVRADSGIKNWSDLRDKRVVTTKGTTNAQTLIDRDKIRSLNITLLESKDHAAAFAMVERKEADVFAMDDVLLNGLRAAAKNPSDFIVVGDSLSAEPYAILLARQDPDFKHLVDREISRIMLDGEIYAMYKKWFASPIFPNGINLNMPMSHLLRASIRVPSDKVAD